MVRIGKSFGSEWARKLLASMIEHSPEIAAGIGVSGFIAAIGVTYRNAKDIHDGIQEKNYRKVLRKSAPIVILASGSALMIRAGVKESNKRIATYATAYSLLEGAHTEFKEQTKDTVGEKRNKAIEENVREDIVTKAMNGVDPEMIEFTGKGDQIFCEILTGRLFKSDAAEVNAAMIRANKMFDDMSNGEMVVVTLQDLHEELHIETREIDDKICWKVDPMDPKNNSRVEYNLGAILYNDIPISTIEYRAYGFIDPKTWKFVKLDC